MSHSLLYRTFTLTYQQRFRVKKKFEFRSVSSSFLTKLLQMRCVHKNNLKSRLYQYNHLNNNVITNLLLNRIQSRLA